MKALAHQTGWGALLPLEGVLKTQALAPLPLLRDVAVMVRSIDPEETTGLIHEVTIVSLCDSRHPEVPH